MSKHSTLETSTGAKHTHFSDDEECTSKAKKEEPTKVEKVEVQSANSWEKADLGDGDRKNKFLRLMGASKKKHQGRFVIGDNSRHQKASEVSGKNLNEKLEEQYKQSMDHRLTGGRGSHLGLGFQDDNAVTKVDGGEQVSTDEPTNNDEKDTVSEKGKKDEQIDKDRKRHSDTKVADHEESGVKKMKFLKSSID